jgi:nicotinamide-nucleotide adenylyltransferase
MISLRYSRRLFSTMSVKSRRPNLELLRQQYQSALHKFTASSDTFQVIDSLSTCTQEEEVDKKSETTALYVLDSSFNPPSLAHLHIARTAVVSSTSSNEDQHDLVHLRLLLLLATQNADKPTKPALFEDRLVMMNLFGRDLLDSLQTSLANSSGLPSIDIGLTSQPYFIDKASSITRSNAYSLADVQQIHLTGYDTLIRIFEPKYYPPSHTLGPLAPFLSTHRLRVTMRPDDGWGGREEQEAFLRGLKEGALEAVGGKREWADQIELVEGCVDDEQGPVSSTRARQAAVAGDSEGLGKVVTESVKDYVLERSVYAES